MTDGRVEAVLAQVRASGGRVTRSRRALVTEVADAGGHLSADDLADRLRRSHPELAASTVYRLLTDLEERGLVRHVHTVHGPAVYHLADPTHHHLRCSRCGHVTDIPDAVLAPVRRLLHDRYGFDLDLGHTALPGTCAACAEGGPGAATEPAAGGFGGTGGG